jgi:hypothetical protein
MPTVPEGCKLFLDPQDDYNHEPDDVSNYNESMYFSVLDPVQKMGGWYRLGNRVNEGYAEMSNCWYLPDGRVAFMAFRPRITTNEVMDAGGLRFEILEPMRRHRILYDGKVCLLENPHDMLDPGTAFKKNPVVPMRMEVSHEASSPVSGGEIRRADGTPLPLDPNKGFAKAHTDQFMAGEGFIEVDGERFEFSGHGARDKSWGPRYWQHIDWYRWMHLYAGPDLQIVATVMDEGEGEDRRVTGLAYDTESVEHFEVGEIYVDWDEADYQTTFRFETRFRDADRVIEGRVRSLIPLRNRRELDDGTVLHTRITEAITDYTLDGTPCIGMSEFLDQIVDGKPSGMLA